MRIGIEGVVAGLVLVVCLGLAPAAQASLGESADSVARDNVALHARSTELTPMLTYDRYETTTVAGTQLRQFVSHGGAVFAVAFNGPVMPDLKVLLGTRYANYVSAANARRANHKVLSIDSPGLVLEVVKLPRGFAGSAHVPQLVPAGVLSRELR